MAIIKRVLSVPGAAEDDILYPETSSDQVKSGADSTVEADLAAISVDVSDVVASVALAADKIDTNTENIATMKLQTDKVPSIEATQTEQGAAIAAQNTAIGMVEDSVTSVDAKTGINALNISSNQAAIDASSIRITCNARSILPGAVVEQPITISSSFPVYYNMLVTNTLGDNPTIVMSGGRDRNNSTSRYIFRILSDGTVEYLDNMALVRTDHPVVALADGSVVIAGGVTSTIERYDASGVDSNIYTMPDDYDRFMIGAGIDNIVVFIGGTTNGIDGNATDRILILDVGSTVTATTPLTLSTIRSSMGVCVRDGEIIVFGGNINHTTTDIVEGFRLDDTETTVYPSLSVSSYYPSPAVFGNGDILVVNGYAGSSSAVVDRYSSEMVKTVVPADGIIIDDPTKATGTTGHTVTRPYSNPIITRSDGTILYADNASNVHKFNEDGTKSIVAVVESITSYFAIGFGLFNGEPALVSRSNLTIFEDDIVNPYYQIVPPYSRYYLESDPTNIMQTTGSEISVEVPYEDTIVITQGIEVNTSNIVLPPEPDTRVITSIYADVDPIVTSSASSSNLATSSYILSAATLGDGAAIFGGGQYSTSGRRSNVTRIGVDGVSTTLTSLSVARTQLAAASLGDGSVIFAGGYGTSSSNYYTNAERYSVAGAKTTLTALSDGRSELSAVTDGAGNAYFIGGVISTTAVTNIIDKYNVAGVKTVFSSLPVTRGGMGAGTLGNGSIVLAGGFNISSSVRFYYGEVFKYDYDGTRTSLDSLSARSGMASATLADGSVIFAGGIYDTLLRTYVDKYTIDGIHTSLDPLSISPTSVTGCSTPDGIGVIISANDVEVIADLYTSTGVHVSEDISSFFPDGARYGAVAALGDGSVLHGGGLSTTLGLYSSTVRLSIKPNSIPIPAGCKYWLGSDPDVVTYTSEDTKIQIPKDDTIHIQYGIKANLSDFIS